MEPVYKKIAIRLVPLLMLLYFVAFLDRVNISFAALTMNRDIGISEGYFGIAAGIFFLGYFLFEVPSNLILVRLGARRWIAIIMVLWGLLSFGTAFVHTPTQYLLLRFFLGVAESGFYPGIILYLTFWLPSTVRSSLMALFITAIPISGMVGSPISARILLLDQIAGLRGWQWLFILEGVPAILLGLLAYVVLADGPQNVSWLTSKDKQKIAQDIAEEVIPSHRARSTIQALRNRPSVFGFSFAYFALMIALYGIGFWIPKLLQMRGVNLLNTGWLTAVPYLVGIVGMIVWSRRSDKYQERTKHLTIAYTIAAIGLVTVIFAPTTAVAVLGFSLGTLGIFAAMPVFWSASTLYLAGPMVGVYIAVINSIGNLGGFVGPSAMGWLLQATHSFATGLASIAICLLIGAFTLQRLGRVNTFGELSTIKVKEK